jgi:hypothetical protein
VDVNIHPASAQIVARHIDDVGAEGCFPRAYVLDLATSYMNVSDFVDSLFGV